MASSFHGSERSVHSNCCCPSEVTPFCDVICVCPVTATSFKSRSAMRVATSLRWPTCPTRLATRNASIATGITIAMKTSAASTSTSVKPFRLAAQYSVVINLLNFIPQPICALADPQHLFFTLTQLNAWRARFRDRAIGQKPDRWQVSYNPIVLNGANTGNKVLNRRDFRFNFQVFIQIKLYCFIILIQKSGRRPQAVALLLPINPEEHRNTFGDGATLAIFRQGQYPACFRIQIAA